MNTYEYTVPKGTTGHITKQFDSFKAYTTVQEHTFQDPLLPTQFIMTRSEAESHIKTLLMNELMYSELASASLYQLEYIWVLTYERGQCVFYDEANRTNWFLVVDANKLHAKKVYRNAYKLDINTDDVRPPRRVYAEYLNQLYRLGAKGK